MRRKPPKKKPDRKHDGMLPEYDFCGGQRGKYAKRYRQGTKIKIRSEKP